MRTIGSGAEAARPARTLSVADAMFVVIGIVIGAGIFKAPSLVAANVGSELEMLAVWLAGGAVALIGALCYAELASAWPDTGGDYRYLARAFGRSPAFLFAWARLAVMQTGSIALLAFVFGDYASEALPLGEQSAALYAMGAVVVFTLVNVAGIREGAGAQRLFTIIEVLGLLVIVAACLLFAAGTIPPQSAPPGTAATPAAGAAALGLAMVFVLLTFGGWNEAAFVSAEVRGGRVPVAKALIASLLLITGLYLLVNLAYARVLGLEGMAASEAVAASAMERVLGSGGALFVSATVGICALTSLNATIITGARCNHALGRDFALFAPLGRWNARAGTPVVALLVQGIIALLLVGLGAATRTGFATLVEYTAPVFWFFFLLTGVALFRLRRTEPETPRPFRVPLYPLTPLLFCASSAYMLWSSVRYTGIGALVGVAVLLLGLPLLWLAHRRESRHGPHEEGDVDDLRSPIPRRSRSHALAARGGCCSIARAAGAASGGAASGGARGALRAHPRQRRAPDARDGESDLEGHGL